MKMDNQKTGEFIKDLLQERQMNQSDLAKVLNITEAAVSKNLKGKTGFDLSNLAIIAEYFNISIDELVNAKRKAKRDFQSDLEQIAYQGIERVEELLKEKNKIFLSNDTYGKTIIEYALMKDDVELVLFLLNHYLYPEIFELDKKVRLYDHPLFVKFVLKHQLVDLLDIKYWYGKDPKYRTNKGPVKHDTLADFTGKNVIYAYNEKLSFDYRNPELADIAVGIKDMDFFHATMVSTKEAGRLPNAISSSWKRDIFGREIELLDRQGKLENKRNPHIQQNRASSGNLFYLYNLCVEKVNLPLFEYLDERIKLTTDHLYYYIESKNFDMVKHIIKTRPNIRIDLEKLLELGGTDLVNKINTYNNRGN